MCNEPKCPKCSGRLMRVPDGTYPYPTIRCLECSWFVEKTPETVMPYIGKTPVGVKEGGKRGGVNSRAVTPLEIDVDDIKVKVYVEIVHGKRLHLYKSELTKTQGKNARAYCGTTGVKVLDIAGRTICSTCIKNLQQVSEKIDINCKVDE